MAIRVLFFSLLRDRAGASEVSLEVEADSTVADVLQAVSKDRPALASLVKEHPTLVLASVNRNHAPLDTAVTNGDEVAFFPPVSGGSPATKGMLLLSGGFDSPVAAHLTLEHGHALEAVHFSMEPFTDDASCRKAQQLAQILGIQRLTIVTIGAQLAEFNKKCNPRHYFVLQKRFMVRIAQTLAAERGAEFLITGENLGQVSSQTLVNLAAIDRVATLPVLRPLLGWDKVDIIDYARRIGTFEASKGPEVCDVLGPRHPSTAVPVAAVEEDETHLPMDELLQAALKGQVTYEWASRAA